MSDNDADVRMGLSLRLGADPDRCGGGIRRYGWHTNRIWYNFLATILENFRREPNREKKYNVVTRSSESGVHAGYQQNVIEPWVGLMRRFWCLNRSCPQVGKEQVAVGPR